MGPKQIIYRLLIAALATLALGFNLQKGDWVQIEQYFNGRATPNFLKATRNVRLIVPKGSVGEIQEIRPFKKTGNFGLQIKLQNEPHKGEVVWIYFNDHVRDPGIKLRDKSGQAVAAPAHASTAQMTRPQSAVRPAVLNGAGEEVEEAPPATPPAISPASVNPAGRVNPPASANPAGRVNPPASADLAGRQAVVRAQEALAAVNATTPQVRCPGQAVVAPNRPNPVARTPVGTQSCVTTEEASAFKIYRLSSMLTVASLNVSRREASGREVDRPYCGVTVAQVNEIRNRFKSELVATEDSLEGYFKRRFGSRGQDRLDNFKTEDFNTVARIPSATLCASVPALISELRSLPPGQLAGYAAKKIQTPSVNLPLCLK